MWRLRKDAHPVLTDEGGAILSERTGRWTYLTPSAAWALRCLLAAGDETQAAGPYAARYGLPPVQAAADLRSVAAHLAAQDLTVPPALPRRWGWRWGR
ncbi:PqqD family protein [Streptomyces sp. NPDC003077]|uniref:PqqD family protein n=1 Tax=Streptomyces sp. NPDC003077 TaxID=3154443 RepID=UPI0033A9D814